MVNGWLAVLLVGAAGAALAYWWRGRGEDSGGRERPVLPSHYSSLLQADPSHYPGLCPDCGTENTPGYSYCRECGERLPGGTESKRDTDVASIFEE